MWADSIVSLAVFFTFGSYGLGSMRLGWERCWPPDWKSLVACIDELTPVSLEQFLKQRAVNVSVGGSYTLPRWYDPHGRPRKFTCRTRRVSPFRMIVDVPVVGKIGDRLTSYFSEFGEFEGKISDTRSGSFLLELDMQRRRCVWMSEKLTWLEKKQKQRGIRDVRKDARLVPQTYHTRRLHSPMELCTPASLWMFPLPELRYPPNTCRQSECPWRSDRASVASSGDSNTVSRSNL